MSSFKNFIMEKFESSLIASKEKKDDGLEKLTKETIDRVIKKYPDRVPVIVKPMDNKQPKINKTKYLVPKDMCLAQFIYIIKSRLEDFGKEEALFIFINKALPKTTDTMVEIYERHKNEDKFLYVEYSIENTFG